MSASSAPAKSSATSKSSASYPNKEKKPSVEEAEVDALIEQLSSSTTAAEVTPTASASGAAGAEPTSKTTPFKHGKRHLIGKGTPAGGSTAFVNAKKEAAVTKNSRKPRNGVGRGLPKKGGAGGKGVWGKPGDELIDYEEDMRYEAEDEPNEYDAAQMQKDEIVKPEQLRTALAPVLNEFYNHGKTGEVQRFLQNISIKPTLVHMIAYTAVVVSMDKKACEREMTSTLLGDLYDSILNEEQFEGAFDQLLMDLPDLVLDCPEASVIVGNYIARCIADDCLAPKYLEVRQEKFAGPDGGASSQDARKTLATASVLINMKHGLVRLDNVWGVSGGIRPVKHLIKKMHAILKEYVESSGDVMEALRCLEELHVPHFNHEFVYEAILMVTEDGKERAFDLMLKLLKEAAQELVLTVDQLTTGFQRVYDDLDDIVLDVPAAYPAIEKFATQCQQQGIIPQDLLKKFPTRGRKRYVSENDGGRLKEDVDFSKEEFRQRVASNPAPKEEDEDDDDE